MKAEPELKLTLICKTCQNQYGRWRPHCPVCRTVTPASAMQPLNPPRLVVTRERERGQDDCIFCHRRKAKERCPHCNEPIHKNCQGLHIGDCAKFQVERQAEIARVSA